MMARLHPDDIQAIAERVVALLGGAPTLPAPPVDPGQYAINLAKAGRIEESKQFLRSLSRRKAA